MHQIPYAVPIYTTVSMILVLACLQTWPEHRCGGEASTLCLGAHAA